MDAREAVIYLDIYSDDLVSLSILVKASTLQDDTDDEICEAYKDLKTAIVKKQKEAMLLAHGIVTATKRQRGTSDHSVDVLEINAAIQRLVAADMQASEALKPPPESFAARVARMEREMAAEEADSDRLEEEQMRRQSGHP